MTTLPDNFWLPQASKPSREDMTGAGQQSFTFLAKKGRGKQTAAEKGYVLGQSTILGGIGYELATIAVDDDGGGAFDLVTITYQSIHGTSSPSFAKKRRAGTEEWRLRGAVEVMTGSEALEQGWVNSGSDLPDGDLERRITVNKPQLERRRWIKGDTQQRILPATFEKAVSLYTPYIAALGKAIAEGSKWQCIDVTTEQDGALILVTEIYEWRPNGWPQLVTQ